MEKDAREDRFAEETLRFLTESGAILENDHFVYISGDHGSGWIDKDAIYPHTERIERLCRDLAIGLRGWDVEVVCGPATGGLIVAQWAAHELGALSVFTEHDDRGRGRRPARPVRAPARATTGSSRASACWSSTTS